MSKKYKNDIIIISFFLILAIIFTIIINIFKKDGEYVYVSIDDKLYATYTLNEDITIELDTGNTLVIKDKKAYVIDSTCKDKICVNHDKISSVGETIICLPHKLIIEIKEED